MIASVAGEIRDGALTAKRPFRSPHHSASMAALTGGGLRAKPGEISLAHQGVLFLDELPEFDPRVLDSLRQPLENGEVSVSRANHRVTYPARFMLVAAMNPCRCGHAFEPGYSCKRGRIDRCTGDYQSRISGPLMDRIDLRIEVPAVTAADLILPPRRKDRPKSPRASLPRAISSFCVTRRPACRISAPTRRRRRRCSKKRQSSTGRAQNCCATPPRPCGCRRVAIIACSGSRVRSPTSTAPTRSAASISPKPCRIARSPRTYEAQRDATFTSPRPDRVNTQVTSSVYAPQTISPCVCVAGLSSGWRKMLRFKVLVSIVPLTVAAILAGVQPTIAPWSSRRP